jgi:Domain of unknown function DUF29
MHPNAILYADDIYAWARTTAALIRAGKWDEVDAALVAEEIEDMAASTYRAVSSAVYQILVHLLKWSYQPRRRSRSWQVSLVEHRNRVPRGVCQMRSLATQIPAMIKAEYPAACHKASVQTGLPRTTFPETCPWTERQVLSQDFYPDAPVG